MKIVICISLFSASVFLVIKDIGLTRILYSGRVTLKNDLSDKTADNAYAVALLEKRKLDADFLEQSQAEVKQRESGQALYSKFFVGPASSGTSIEDVRRRMIGFGFEFDDVYGRLLTKLKLQPGEIARLQTELFSEREMINRMYSFFESENVPPEDRNAVLAYFAADSDQKLQAIMGSAAVDDLRDYQDHLRRNIFVDGTVAKQMDEMASPIDEKTRTLLVHLIDDQAETSSGPIYLSDEVLVRVQPFLSQEQNDLLKLISRENEATRKVLAMIDAKKGAPVH
jgi:hypothetical protein